MAEFTFNEACKFMTDASGGDIEHRTTHGSVKRRIRSFGFLHLASSSDEARQCSEILDILRDYANREDPPRPLSVAVFGPPGSGKSFGVKQIMNAVGGYEKPCTINLSQLTDVSELGQAVVEALAQPSKGNTRAIFFDEFDSPLAGDNLGWLKSFLAPMQDGLFFANGKQFTVGKALFVFAGGTTERFDDFQKRYENEFVIRKGPDFVSRLRGILDVGGLNGNGPEYLLRRALVLHYQLGERSESLKGKNDTRNIDKNLLEQLLCGVHYVHGARSMEAVLEMSELTGKSVFKEEDLPGHSLRRLHLSRGPMQNLAVGISADVAGRRSKSVVEEAAEVLLQQGASLAYGGDLWDRGTLESMANVVAQRPAGLVKAGTKPIRSFLPYPVFCNPDTKSAIARIQGLSAHVEVNELETLSTAEIKELLGKKPPLHGDWFGATGYKNMKDEKDPAKRPSWNPAACHAAWALSLFRMRLRQAQEIDALLVVGGKPGPKSWGRFSGIAEEMMLALAHRKPVYILGMAGGAASALGDFLGLGDTLGKEPECLQTSKVEADFAGILERLRKKFEVPYISGLPLTKVEELREYLVKFSLRGSKWPDNGLSLEENKELFACENTIPGRARAVELIVSGISRLPAG